MGQFLEKYNLPKLSQKKSENLDRLITTDEIEHTANLLRADHFNPTDP